MLKDPKCNAFYKEELWESCYGQIAIKPCNNDSETTFAFWECLPSGNFNGPAPDFTDCSSSWIENLEEAVEKVIIHPTLNKKFTII